jgi:hypothetical protein
MLDIELFLMDAMNLVPLFEKKNSTIISRQKMIIYVRHHQVLEIDLQQYHKVTLELETKDFFSFNIQI